MPSTNLTCACGCGRDPGVYAFTDHRKGAIKGAPRRYCTGHSRKGVTLNAETRAKITGRPIKADAGVGSIHKWLRQNFPKTGRCEKCGREGKTDYAFLRHPESYTRDIADYRELCRSCHFKFDEPFLNRGADLNQRLTTEQRQAAGRKGAAVRWGSA